MHFKGLNVFNYGLKPGRSFDQNLKVRLVNICVFLALINTLPYLASFFTKALPIGPFAAVCCSAFAATWFLNKYGQYNKAKIWLYTWSLIYLFVAASVLGKESGVHYMLMPVLFSAVLIFDFREKKRLLFTVLLGLAAIIVLEITDYSLFALNISSDIIRYYYYGSLVVTFIASLFIGLFYFYLYDKQLKENRLMLETSKEIENTISYFSNSLFGKNTVDEILWDVTKNCIGKLGFEDCVIYLLDENSQLLIQKAAYGAKNPHDFEIYKPMDIPVGRGIVGFVAQTAEAIIINDTSGDERYIVDDQNRLSEIAAPLIYNNKVIGVIDSEHPEKNFFTQRHLSILKTISSLCANKVARARADEEQAKALKIKMEAEKIKAFDDLKSKLFANISHELRTPLTLIMGTINKHLESETTEDWKLLRRHTDRLLRLINQLLDLTKLESGQFKLKPQAGDIMSFLRITISLFTSLAASRNVNLKHNIKDTSLWLHFDQDALEKIFFNLLSNAVKFTRDKSAITVTVTYDQQLNVSIADRGPGISPEEQTRIFERFYQTSRSTNMSTGIGLSLVKELIDLHKGSIEVKNNEDAGCTFTIKLPLKKVGGGRNT